MRLKELEVRDYISDQDVSWLRSVLEEYAEDVDLRFSLMEVLDEQDPYLGQFCLAWDRIEVELDIGGMAVLMFLYGRRMALMLLGNSLKRCAESAEVCTGVAFIPLSTAEREMRARWVEVVQSR